MLNQPSLCCIQKNNQPVPLSQSPGSPKPINRNRETARKAAAGSQGLQSVKSLLGESSLRLLRWHNITHSNALGDLILAHQKHGFLCSAFSSLCNCSAFPSPNWSRLFFFHWGCAQFLWPLSQLPQVKSLNWGEHQDPRDACLPSHSSLPHFKNLLKGAFT